MTLIPENVAACNTRLTLPLLLITLLSISPGAWAQTTETVSDDKTKEQSARVDKLISFWDKPGSPGVSVAVWHQGKMVYSKGVGNAQLEYDIPNTPQTIFHAASISKQFTAFAVIMLADQGKLSLDDEIQKHVPEVPDFGKKITLRHLIHHTSGLRDQWELFMLSGGRLDDVITQQHILSLVSRQRELNFDPGEEFMYCNTGYTLLAEVVARTTDQSFKDWSAENIFKPLGMEHTHFHDDNTQNVPGRSYSYLADGSNFKKAALNFSNAGATSLFTTPEDLVRWTRNLTTGKVGGKKVLEVMMTPGKLNNGKELTYGGGLMFWQHKGVDVYGHSGRDAGYLGKVSCFPEQDLIIAIMANVGNCPVDPLTSRIADIYLSEHLQQTSKEQSSPKKLEQYVGRYYSDEVDTSYTVTINEGTVEISHWRHGTARLRPAAGDVFRSSGVFRSVRFERDDQGKVTELLISTGRVRNLRFKRQSD